MKIHRTQIGLAVLSLLLLCSVRNVDSKETLEEYRARTQEDVYRRSNDAYAAGGQEVRDAFTNLYNDAHSTWKGWKSSLGDKWSNFKQSLRDKADDTSDSVSESFRSTIHDFKKYMDHAEDKGAEYSDEAKQKVQELMKDLRSTYEEYKAATKARVDEWSQDAKDKAEEGASEVKDKANEAKEKAVQAYKDARAKYLKSKENFSREMDKIKHDASSKSHKAGKKIEKEYKHAKADAEQKADNSYESLKQGAKNLYDDATASLNKYREKIASKWQEYRGGKSPADDFHNTINDFQHYEKVFEESADKYSEQARGRIGQLLDSLRESYEDLKEKTKDRVSDWTPDTTDNGQSPAFDEYEEALFRFNQSKARLNTEMTYLSGGDKTSYQNAVKAQLEGLYNDASSTLLSWKEKLGDRWDQAVGTEDKGKSSNPDAFSSQDFLDYLQVYEATKAQNSYTDEARIKLGELIDSLQDRYQSYKSASVKRWNSLMSGDDKAQSSKAVQKYDQAKNAYTQSKERLQDELNYLTGKLSKEEYDAKVHAHDKAGLERATDAIKSGWRAVKDRVKAGTDYVKETVTGQSSDDDKKAKKDQAPSDEM